MHQFGCDCIGIVRVSLGNLDFAIAPGAANMSSHTLRNDLPVLIEIIDFLDDLFSFFGLAEVAVLDFFDRRSLVLLERAAAARRGAAAVSLQRTCLSGGADRRGAKVSGRV